MFGRLFQLVFTDIKNKLIFTTTDNAKNIIRYQLDFVPSEVFFQESDPQVLMILDTTTLNRTVRIIFVLIEKMNSIFSFFIWSYGCRKILGRVFKFTIYSSNLCFGWTTCLSLKNGSRQIMVPSCILHSFHCLLKYI